ncbi:transglutaminaseTgpA domain-containing protein [Streptomyces sp. NPDC005752]|uniref:transglutaminase TgpA family protein n=1 Tax=Streptomyces sp. NPDC005752 TaxID=3157065 RepID=UPI0033D86B1D
MSGRTRLALCAFAATMMTAGALLPLVETSGWLLQAAFLLAVQSGVGALARRMRLARILTVSLQALATLLTLTAAFAREHALLGVLPGPRTVQRLAELLTTGADDVGRYAIPAPATDGILLMLIGGILLIGLAVDVLAVTCRAAAAAGLPLLALYSVAAGLSDGGAGWLWFLLAACGYLLLLLAEGRDRLSRWGRVFGGAPRTQGGPAAGQGAGRALAPVRTGRRIGVVALGIALAVPAALPALDGGLLGGTGGGSRGGSGGGTISAVNPLVSLQNNLNQPENREVMTYRTNSANPGDLYLRILALDQFSGGEWRPSTRRLRDVPDRLPQPSGLGQDVAVTEIRTNISASPSYRQTYLPLPYPASEVDVRGRWRYEPEGRTLVGDDGQTTRGARYEVSSLSVEPTAAQLARSTAPPPDLAREYTRVPPSLPDVVGKTAARVTEGAADDYERAVRLQDWFTSEGGFRYDTTVTSGTGTTAIERFLKEKEGFCVHFSFAMAAMARTLDIPARVAVGFTPGTVQADGSVSVGLQDAHAWPELYFEGVGWTRFEPTPSRGSTPAYTLPDAPSQDPSDPAQPTDGASVAPTAEPSASESCPAQTRQPGECGASAAAGVADSADPGTPAGTVVLWVLGALVVLVLPLMPMLWRMRARARRLSSSGGRTASDTAARVMAAWREITDTAWDHGIPPDDSQTPRKAAARVVRLGGLEGPASAAVHRVAGAVERVLYAPEPGGITTPVEDVREVRAGLRASGGRWNTLRATLAPRSAVRVVRAGSERLSELGRRWSGVVGRLRPAPGARRSSRQRG